jgi:hypothetical protein
LFIKKRINLKSEGHLHRQARAATSVSEAGSYFYIFIQAHMCQQHLWAMLNGLIIFNIKIYMNGELFRVKRIIKFRKCRPSGSQRKPIQTI